MTDGRNPSILPTGQPWRESWTTTPEDIVACFHLLLGRNPNPEEVGHFSRVGMDLKEIVGTFLDSYEFSLRGMSNQSRQGAVELVECRDFRIHVSPGDADVGRNVKKGAYEPHVEAAVRRHVKPGMVMVDIGANIGYFAMMGGALVGPTGRVYAVEPNPDNARMIEASRRTNGFQHVKVLQTAAGRDFGILVLNASHSNGTTAEVPPDVAVVLNARTVMASPLGSLIPASDRIGFIKIDVEGAEAAALEGLQDRIGRDRPVVASEFCPPMLEGISRCTGEGYLRFFTNRGYALSVLSYDLEVIPCGQDVDKVMAAWRASGVDHIDFLAEPL